MLPEFPVSQISQQRLLKILNASTPIVAKVSMMIENSSNDELKCNIVGSNLKGFVAGEFFIQYNPLIVNLTKGSISTAIRGASLNSKLDTDSKLLKVALVTNDDIDENDPVTLISITLPPAIGDASTAFSINTALINEGKIATDINTTNIRTRFSQPLSGNHGIEMSVKGRHITIYSQNAETLEINIWSLNGKLITNKKINKVNSYHDFNINHLSRGIYLYRIRNGATLLKGRLAITK